LGELVFAIGHDELAARSHGRHQHVSHASIAGSPSRARIKFGKPSSLYQVGVPSWSVRQLSGTGTTSVT
jgi:hypothetical protein